MPSFLSGGVEIAYEVEGAGEPVLLIHGFASNVQMNWVETNWAKTLVDDGRQVIMYDNRGHGRSAKLYDPDVYGAEIMAEDAYRLLAHLNIERCDVMGYSMGARISAFLAIAHPDVVRCAVFGGLGEAMILGVPGAQAVAEALEAEHIDDIKDKSARAFRLFGEATKSDLRALAACIRSSRVKINPDDLARISVPVLVAVGENDEIAGLPQPLAEIMTKGEALLIPGRDHMRATGDKVFKAAVLDLLKRRP